MRRIGNYGEQLAISYLLNKGYSIITRNFYTRFGEIDIIASQLRRVHIIEVKYISKNHINVAYKINRRKRLRMIQTACISIEKYQLMNHYIQFDLIIITNNQIKHLKNVFNLNDV